MMPVVRISEPTWKRLQNHAKPFEDSVDDIINKAISALEKLESLPANLYDPQPKILEPSKKKISNKNLPKTPQSWFREPLLRELSLLGGGSAVAAIRASILPKIENELLEGDFALVSTGEPRWWNAICWERNELKKSGLLRDDSRRGFWELNQVGLAAANSLNK